MAIQLFSDGIISAPIVIPTIKSAVIAAEIAVEVIKRNAFCVIHIFGIRLKRLTRGAGDKHAGKRYGDDKHRDTRKKRSARRMTGYSSNFSAQETP